MYNTFECHFKPNQKSQSDMVDPVPGIEKPYFSTKDGECLICSFHHCTANFYKEP